jgi:hypothetical protein
MISSCWIFTCDVGVKFQMVNLELLILKLRKLFFSLKIYARTQKDLF